MIVRVPQIDTVTERQAHAIERVDATIREMRERGRGGGFDGDDPRALVLAGDRGFGMQDLADQRDQLSEELTGSRGSRHTMRDLEKRTPLLGRQPSMPPRGVRNWGHLLLKSRVGEIFSPRLGIVGHDSAHFAQISACIWGPRRLLHITSS